MRPEPSSSPAKNKVNLFSAFDISLPLHFYIHRKNEYADYIKLMSDEEWMIQI